MKNILVLIVLLLMPLIVLAQEPESGSNPMQDNPFSAWFLSQAEPGWHYDIGVGLELEAGYPGSDEYSVEPDIFARATFVTAGGHRFFISPGTLGGAFAFANDTQLVAFLEYEEAREVDDDDALIGLDEVKSTIEGQVSLAHRFGKFSVFGVLQPDLTGDAKKGLVWFVGLGYDTFLNDKRWRFATSLDLSGADAEHMNTEFGINEDESNRTNFAIYKPDGGIKSATLALSLEHQFSARFSALASLEAEYYFSEAGSSPLIKDAGSELTYEAGVLLRWNY